MCEVTRMTNPPTAARSRIMRAIKGRGNLTTELAFALLLRRAGITGWRRHVSLPGRPDFSFVSARVSVFIDGCFWHGCPKCYMPPRANRRFWRDKLESNRRRDRRVSRQLWRRGWSVIRIWECDVCRTNSIERVRRKMDARTHQCGVVRTRR